ncbi:protein of unknown function [Candidatus Nitrosocosmicus franklandus]|uniref:Uncharacterized protein n=1 Tax=Candidatus Nitrosocosmicus franklandianus TaxID=1798806 RepID=A0A484I7M5_9ARCH|nr:protein of unknown function [Candidatus Nitrosocosmicus franklandus]VFJ12801.1 protein of unknown function [Candidatus Nitrosocosmicus franklandus]VFJ13369.1 protein of unknown function [Candidatus Nitrosocosmicus franklandus]VFJ14300.1 protein of unknown function [Candidatus Nitrosocosmicus franklandus]VFJ14651.1 protein of unknown function [Candidatus Nitrosocosmicus franklandus]
MCIMAYICTFQVFLLGKHLKDYHTVSNEIMSLSGTGFKSTNLRLSRQNKEGYVNSL